MGKVKKSVKKFAAKGPEAAKKAVRTHKLELAKRQKAKAAQEHKAQIGTGKKKKNRGDESDDDEEGVAAPSLEGMDVDAFMEGMGASSDEDDDEASGSEGEDKLLRSALKTASRQSMIYLDPMMMLVFLFESNCLVQ